MADTPEQMGPNDGEERQKLTPQPGHLPAADSDSSLTNDHVGVTPDLERERQQVAPLSLELREGIRVDLSIRFASSVQMLVEKAADSFSAVLQPTEELAFNPEAEHLIERHQAAKRALIDLVERAADIAARVSTELEAETLEGAAVVSIYDQDIAPWLGEYGGFLETIMLLERDLSKLVTDAAAEEMQGDYEEPEANTDEELDEDDDDEAEFDTGSDDADLEDGYPSVEEADQDVADEHFGDPIIDNSPDVRFLMSYSQSLMIFDPVEAVKADTNLCTLELLRVQGIGSEFSTTTVLVPMEITEVLYCLNHVAYAIRDEFRQVITEAAEQKLAEGKLYQGESGARFREVVGEHFRSQHPLRAEVGNDGTITIVHDVPEELREIWESHQEALAEKLTIAKCILEARGHGLRRNLETFQLRFSDFVTSESEEAGEYEIVPSHLYCDAQQEALSISKSDLYGKLSPNTHVALPRNPIGATANTEPYRFTAEDAALQAIGIVRPLDTLLGQIDRFVGALDQPGMCVAVNCRVIGDQPDYIIQEPYENGGPLNIHLFTPNSISASSLFLYQDDLDAKRLIEYIRTISSEPSTELAALARPFKVSPPMFAEAPRGVNLKLDEILVSSGDIRKGIVELCKHGHARLSLGHDYFYDYKGAELRVDLVEHAIAELVKAKRSLIGDAPFRASADWFAGVAVNGIEAFKEGLLLRLHDSEGALVAQGLLSGRDGLTDCIVPVESKLIAEACASVERCFQGGKKVENSVSAFEERLAEAGLQFDDVYLFMSAFQVARGNLTTGYVSASPVDLLKRMIEMPELTVEQNGSSLLVRKAGSSDFIR